MNYAIADIEDQILATLTRDTLTGTMASTSTAVVGTNTVFTTELTVGDQIVAPANTVTPTQERAGTGVYTVSVITDNTNLTLSTAPSPALSGAAFAKRFPDGTAFEAATYAGDLNANLFMIPEFHQGLVHRLPLIFVQYLGRATTKPDHDSVHGIYQHILTFRLYIGTENQRSGQEASRAAYDMLADVYDRLHGKVPVMASSQKLPGLTVLEGVPINMTTYPSFNPLTPLVETGGADERLVVNLPDIKVFSTDFKIKLVT